MVSAGNKYKYTKNMGACKKYIGELSYAVLFDNSANFAVITFNAVVFS
jgi:hypothetical protein